MFVDDSARPTIAGWAPPAHPGATAEPAPPPAAVPPPAAGWRVPDVRPGDALRPRRDGLSRRAGHRIAGAFAVAWILCPLVEPLPSGPTPAYPLWQLPIDLGTLASIVAAVIVLWRGGRLGPLLGAIAGAFMLLETAVCPIAGHTPVGWWTWTQTVLSLLVLGTSAALLARQDTTA